MVLTHLASGSGLRDVASRLHMSLKTVNTHLHNLRGKLGVHSTLAAVALARSGSPGLPRQMTEPDRRDQDQVIFARGFRAAARRPGNTIQIN